MCVGNDTHVQAYGVYGLMHAVRVSVVACMCPHCLTRTQRRPCGRAAFSKVWQVAASVPHCLIRKRIRPLVYTVHGLPYGGVGQSGFGSYHGKYSFDLFSHEKVCLVPWCWPRDFRLPGLRGKPEGY